MDKYNQRYEKKKICPKCNGKVYNATLTCKLVNNNKKCNYYFISKKQKILYNNDIQIINKLAKFKDITCLSPYEERELQIITSKNY
jgi:hypothetical protein